VADIDVERKAGPPVWMWILGLLLLALIIWAIVSMMGRDDTRTVAPLTDTAVAPVGMTDPGTTAATLPPQAQTFMQDCYLDEGQRVEEMGLDHTFTVNCFNNLAASIDGFAQQHGADADVRQHTQTIRERMQQIEQSPAESTQHANWTREAAQAGASAMEALQGRSASPGAAQAPVQRMRQNAQEIERTELHMEQLTHLRSYFRSAGDALNAMVGRS
jgi:hypothetical protein